MFHHSVKGEYMRTILIALFTTLATQVSSEAASGMLVCNPNDISEEPVVYSFDGEFLLRDNNPKFPYMNLLTVQENIFLYFGYELSEYKMAKLDRELEKYSKIKADVWKIKTEIKNFKRYCKVASKNSTYTNFTMHKNFSKSLRESNQCIDPLTRKDRCDYSFEVDYKLLPSERCSNISQLEDNYIPRQPSLSFEDFDQVKLTINLNSMKVIEERISSDTGLSAERFVCKSLGIIPPEIDKSQSITPIPKDIEQSL